MRGRVQQREKPREVFFQPMWMKHIPMTYEDFKDKEENWLGFSYALKSIGLDSNEVKKRLIEGKPPWKMRKNKESGVRRQIRITK